MFLYACYKGGREWFAKNIHRYMKEGDIEFKDRTARAYRFNHTKEVVDLVDKYLFKSEIDRNESDAPDSVVAFWKNSTKSGLSISQFSKQMSRKSSIYGSLWVVVDSSIRAVDQNTSVRDVKQAKGKVYAYTVNPDRALDFAVDDDGELIWLLIYEQTRDSKDPFTSTGDVIDRYRLWTKTEWLLLGVKKNEGENDSNGTVVVVDRGSHNLGEVPAFRVDCAISDEQWKAPSLIGDIAYLDKAVANYLSNLDAIIQDQTFSQLAMPAQGLMPGESGYEKMLDMGTKRIFLYDGERGGEPKYLAPDPKQASVILGVISKIINEIYHTVGMAGERTKQDNSQGIDNSSGKAKAMDFERVNSLLVSKANSLEKAERKMARLVALWHGETLPEDEIVKYSKSFDTRGLSDEFQIATQLALVEAPDAIRREQMTTVTEKLFPVIRKEIKAEIEAELINWPPKVGQVLPQKSLVDSKTTTAGQVTAGQVTAGQVTAGQVKNH